LITPRFWTVSIICLRILLFHVGAGLTFPHNRRHLRWICIQFAEVPQDVAFTIEYSARTAREAIHCLLRRGPAPRPSIRASTIRRRCFAALKTLA
jgi:myosin-crossreactive antigen